MNLGAWAVYKRISVPMQSVVSIYYYCYVIRNTLRELKSQILVVNEPQKFLNEYDTGNFWTNSKYKLENKKKKGIISRFHQIF